MAEEFDIMDKYAPKSDATETEETTTTQETTQDVETTSEEHKEDVHTNSETTAETQTEEKPAQEESNTDFNIENFNKAVEGKFESIDQVRELISLSKDYPELKAQLEQRDKTIQEKEEALKQHFDPMSYFANENQFKLNQILKSNEGLNESVAARLLNSNLDELSDKEVLKLNELISTKGTFDEKIVEMAIEDQYGINVKKEDLDDDELRAYHVKEYRMKKDAEKARDSLKGIMDVELPEIKDPNSLKEEQAKAQQEAFDQVKSKWDSSMDTLLEKELNKLTIDYQTDDKKKETFEFEVDDEFKKVLKENLPKVAASYGKDVSKPEDVQALVEQAKKDYLWLRREQVFKTAIEDVVTKMTKEQLDKYNNTSKPKKEEAPERLSDEDKFNKDQQKAMWEHFGLDKKHKK